MEVYTEGPQVRWMVWKILCPYQRRVRLLQHQKKGDYDPRKFYPLNDFQIKEIDEKTAKRKFAFKIIFEHQEVAKDLIMACNTQLQ